MTRTEDDIDNGADRAADDDASSAAGRAGTATEAPFQVEVTVTAPAATVWRALRDREAVRHWHGWDAEGQDAEVDQIYFTDVSEDEATGRLVVNGGDTFDVLDLGGVTRVRLTRGPRDPDDEWDRYYDDINEGWTTFLHQLRFAVEHHPGAVRRTVFLDGSLPSGGGRDAGTDAGPAAALGVGPELAAGATYDAELAGAPEHGTVWFRSPHQVGLTVTGWGDGLLVVGSMPPGPVHPDGVVMGVLSTYGLDDDTFDRLAGRWRSWWAERFPQPVASGGDRPAPAAEPTG